MGKENKFRKILNKITDWAAWVIDFHDRTQAMGDRALLILRYNFASFVHKNRKFLQESKKSIMGHFAGFVLISIAVVALFNHATGFTYAYNGKVLGYVKDQEDVLKVLDLVSTELSKENGAKIKIDADSNISFRKVVIVDKEIDNIDDVLKRLTYMSDMEAEAYRIFINGNPVTTCESQRAAELVLKNVQNEFLETDEHITYEEIGFKEDVEIRKVDTKLAYISSIKAAKNDILTGGSKELVYEVKPGDTYSEICKKFDTSFEELKKINPDLSIENLFIGDKIIINKAVSALTVRTVEKTTYAEKVKYKTEYKKDKSLYENVEKVVQKGSNGKRVVTAEITRENGEEIHKKILKSKTIKKPVKKIVIKGTKKLPKTAPTGTYIIPVSGYTLTSEFGWRWGRNHDGVDLACSTGTPIHASDGGTVVYAGWYSGYGLFVEIDHGGGMKTRYGHCSSIDVSRGEKVYQGQKIAEVGNTGNSYGSHLHFEVLKNGSPVNPFSYL